MTPSSSDDPAARREALERWADEKLGRKPRGRFRIKVAQRLPGPERLARGSLRAIASLRRPADRLADRVLDRGLDTSSQLKLPIHGVEDRVLYVPSSWHVLPRALRYIGVSEEDTFVDFGCGKGRIVHQAALWPFRRVIGVEVSPELAEIARSVLAARSHQHRCRNVEIVVSDVREFRVPDDFTIGYFFRPFGDRTLQAVLQAIVESIDRNPRRVRLIYLWPMTSRSKILATGRFRVVKEQWSPLRGNVDRVAIFESY
jgi:SAM-dependent methyltransferase